MLPRVMPRAPEALLSIANCQIELKDNRSARRTLEELEKAYPKSEAAQAGRQSLIRVWHKERCRIALMNNRQSFCGIGRHGDKDRMSCGARHPDLPRQQSFAAYILQKLVTPAHTGRASGREDQNRDHRRSTAPSGSNDLRVFDLPPRVMRAANIVRHTQHRSF